MDSPCGALGWAKGMDGMDLPKGVLVEAEHFVHVALSGVRPEDFAEVAYMDANHGWTEARTWSTEQTRNKVETWTE